MKQTRCGNEIQITVKRSTLTDGSHVWDVYIKKDEALIRLATADEMAARAVAAETRDAFRDSLEDVPDFDIIGN